jgi:hypothetical protein
MISFSLIGLETEDSGKGEEGGGRWQQVWAYCICPE